MTFIPNSTSANSHSAPASDGRISVIPFHQWLSKKGRRITQGCFAVAGAQAIHGVGFVFGAKLPIFLQRVIPAGFFAIHAALTAITMVWTFFSGFREEKAEAKADDTAAAASVFYWTWFSLLCLWCAFYVLYFIQEAVVPGDFTRAVLRVMSGEAPTTSYQWHAPSGPNTTWVTIVLATLNRLTAVPFLGLYIVVSRRWGPRYRNFIFVVVVGTLFALGVTCLHIMSFSAEFPDMRQRYQRGVEIASCMYVSVAMCLLLGRLDTAFLPSGGLAIPIFYTYACIQMLFPFASGGGILAILFIVSLVLKGYLFLFLSWVLIEGILAGFISTLEEQKVEITQRIEQKVQITEMRQPAREFIGYPVAAR
jgi:hypothetical protein